MEKNGFTDVTVSRSMEGSGKAARRTALPSHVPERTSEPADALGVDKVDG